MFISKQTKLLSCLILSLLAFYQVTLLNEKISESIAQQDTFHVRDLKAVGKESDKSESEEEEDDPRSIKFRTVILVILTSLIVLSVAFDLAKEYVEEHTAETLEPIVEHLWQGIIF